MGLEIQEPGKDFGLRVCWHARNLAGRKESPESVSCVSMPEIRSIFLEVARAMRPVVAAQEVAQRWNSESSLPKFSVRGLAGHLVRCVVTVPRYLEGDRDPAGPPIEGVAYYDRALVTPDVDSPDNASIRARGEELAAGGHAALVELLDEAVADADTALAGSPPDRLVKVVRDLVLHLDDYLVTRVVEIVVHTDDLAHSAGLATPELPPAALETTIRSLVGLARFRHGDMAVVRALARRERDEAKALRVL